MADLKKLAKKGVHYAREAVRDALGGGPAVLKPGDAAPPFEAPDETGRVWKLSDFAGKTLVLWFYPQADTPG